MIGGICNDYRSGNIELMNSILLILWLLILSFFFAKVEIHIEGKSGWAGSLPTWRIEKHVLLDIFWGGRPMTGYHAWIFSFMFLIFHLVFFITWEWSLKIEMKVLASLIFFWIFEDFLWFVLNPAYGINKFNRKNIHWHKKWILFAPVDYWIFFIVASVMMCYS